MTNSNKDSAEEEAGLFIHFSASTPEDCECWCETLSRFARKPTLPSSISDGALLLPPHPINPNISFVQPPQKSMKTRNASAREDVGSPASGFHHFLA
jgi:hypothetical protein